MPLPEQSTAWPPLTLKTAYQQFQVWDAWFSGDTDQLETLYATTRLQTTGGLWNQVRRFFWGTPTPSTQSQRPNKLHVPVASELARMSSSLLFAEMPGIQFGDGDADADDKGLTSMAGKNAMARVTEILDDDAHAKLLEGAELAAAHGGVFLRVSWDTTVDPDKPFITAVSADAAVPEFRWGRLSAVTFWQELAPLESTGGIFRLLERHEPGRIEWGLYLARDMGQLGMRVPLDEHPDAEHLASVVDRDSGIATGSELLTAVYIPNVRPNRKWRKDPVASNLGRSDFDGCEPLFDALDETWTSWMRDLRLGKARVMVAKQLLDVNGPGQGAYFNADREVFVNFDGTGIGSLNPGAQNGRASAGPIEQIQFAIRVKEHADTAQALLERIIATAGYSSATFGEQGDVAMTATEAQSREKLTILTRGAKILYWRPQLAKIVAALMDVDQHVFNGPGRGDAIPDVEFPDAAADAPQVLAQTLSLLNTAEAVSLKTRVEMLHPDWSDEQVNAEVVAIRADYSELPDPTMAHLWTATAGNASATGGVPVTRNGIAGAKPPPAETMAVDDPAGQ